MLVVLVVFVFTVRFSVAIESHPAAFISATEKLPVAL